LNGLGLEVCDVPDPIVPRMGRRLSGRGSSFVLRHVLLRGDVRFGIRGEGGRGREELGGGRDSAAHVMFTMRCNAKSSWGKIM